MGRHKGHNQGTYLERPNGKWRVRISVNGQRLSHEADTKEDAERWVRRQLVDADQGLLSVDGFKVKVGDFLKKWLQTMEPSVKPKTFELYESNVRLYLTPKLGTLRLMELRPDHVQALYNERLKQGLSARTVRVMHCILHRALSEAVRWNLVPRNVCDAVRPPKPARAEINAWTPEEARQFLAGVSGDHFEAAFRLALSTGLRIGEVVGLRWDDIDLQTRRLYVRRTLQRLGRGVGIKVGEPKSARGRRQIVLALQVVESLKRWRVEQMQDKLLAGPHWKETGYVFTSVVGTPIEPGNLRKHFQKWVEKLGLPRIRFHDLRHTCATLLLVQGIHPKVVQELLGHSQISLTLDVYSHVLPTMQEEAAKVMERVLA